MEILFFPDFVFGLNSRRRTTGKYKIIYNVFTFSFYDQNEREIKYILRELRTSTFLEFKINENEWERFYIFS